MEKISRVHHEALKLQHHVFLYKPKLGQEQLEFQRAIQRIQVLNQQLHVGNKPSFIPEKGTSLRLFNW